MRDAEHLLAARDASKLLRHLLGGAAADAGVHLVKNQRAHLILLGQHVLDGQHDPRQLAAGGHLAQGLEGFAHVGRHQKPQLIHAGGRKRNLLQLADELRPGHIQGGQLLGEPLLHGLGSLLARLPQGKPRRLGLGSRLAEIRLQLGKTLLGEGDLV